MLTFCFLVVITVAVFVIGSYFKESGTSTVTIRLPSSSRVMSAKLTTISKLMLGTLTTILLKSKLISSNLKLAFDIGVMFGRRLTIASPTFLSFKNE